jgi:HSP20 family protein
MATPFMQAVAVKMYRTPDRLTLAAPLPGLLPRDITIEVTAAGRLVISAPVRGATADVQLFHRSDLGSPHARTAPVEEARELLVDEWCVGPYRRELDLPNPVDGSLATATYGNGVLVVALPVAPRTTPARFSLEPIGVGRGERVGSRGHPVQPSSTVEHMLLAHQAEFGVWSASSQL